MKFLDFVDNDDVNFTNLIIGEGNLPFIQDEFDTNLLKSLRFVTTFPYSNLVAFLTAYSHYPIYVYLSGPFIGSLTSDTENVSVGKRHVRNL